MSLCSDPKPGLDAESQQEPRTRFETKFQLDWGSDRDGHMWQTSKTTLFGWRTKEPPKRVLKVITRVREKGRVGGSTHPNEPEPG